VIERRDFHEIGPGRGDEVDGFFQGTVTTAGNPPGKNARTVVREERGDGQAFDMAPPSRLQRRGFRIIITLLRDCFASPGAVQTGAPFISGGRMPLPRRFRNRFFRRMVNLELEQREFSVIRSIPLPFLTDHSRCSII
jgi:hypothetical protein